MAVDSAPPPCGSVMLMWPTPLLSQNSGDHVTAEVAVCPGASLIHASTKKGSGCEVSNGWPLAACIATAGWPCNAQGLLALLLTAMVPTRLPLAGWNACDNVNELARHQGTAASGTAPGNAGGWW